MARASAGRFGPGIFFLAVLLALPHPALAEPAEGAEDGPVMSGTKLRWDYPNFNTAQWVTTGLFSALAITMELVGPRETKLRSTFLFDDAARDAMKVEALQDQRTVQSISDALLTLITAYPYLVDSLVVAAWYRRSPSAAWQMALINTQVMAVTLGLTSVAKSMVSRERPYADTCGNERRESLHDCDGRTRYTSFFSGHTSVAFASAGLICMHHMYLDLYGKRAADIGACAAGLGVAAATGVLRMVGDKHYMTDVLAGAAVGSLVGFGLPWVLHYRHGKRGGARTRDGGAVDAQLVPLANGLAISGLFDEEGAMEGDDEHPDALGLAQEAPRGNPWKQGRVRPFLATRLDVGFLFLKPRLSVGYGRPHNVWVGVDANPLLNFEGAGLWGGVRGTLGWIDLRAGARYWYSWNRSYLERRARYDKDDVEDRAEPNASFVSLEAELTFNLPTGPGSMISEFALTYVTGVPDEYNIYEETIKAVVEPPWVWRARLGYMLPVDREKVFKVGLVAEVVAVPRRAIYTMRGGVLVSVRLMRALEARFAFTPVWYNSDDIGSAGSDLLIVGIRHRWATGTPVLQ